MQITATVCIIGIVCLIVRSKKNHQISIKQADGQNKRIIIEKKTSILKKINNTLGFKQNTPDSGTVKTDKELVTQPICENRVKFASDTDKQTFIFKAIESSDNEDESNETDEFHFTYDYNNGTGELYMRCGIAIFRY